MFDDQQTDQSQQHNNVGLGTNPSVVQSTPPVVLPNPVHDDMGDVPLPPAPHHSAPSADTDLEKIKRDALEQLSPLVSKLDQSPEDKYKTLMMMIQNTDNKDLLGDAYESAKNIDDEKVRAEALLNIVNEINYFNQKEQA